MCNMKKKPPWVSQNMPWERNYADRHPHPQLSMKSRDLIASATLQFCEMLLPQEPLIWIACDFICRLLPAWLRNEKNKRLYFSFFL